MKKLVILQTAIPDYRKDIFTYLSKELGKQFELYGGDSYFESSIVTDNSITVIKPLQNFYFLNRKLLFQFGMWHLVLSNNVLILEMNPRILSNWIILIVRNLFFRKTIVWGHAWPRDGKDSKSDSIRNLMRVLASEIIVYTKTQAKDLKEKMPNKIINAAPNALYHKSDMHVCKVKEKIKNIIYVGRLSFLKKALFLVKSFHYSLDDIPKDSQLIIVGDGEEKAEIEHYIAQHELTHRVLVLGHISNFSTLSNLYSTALFSVSPGYVGLSITQSFSFGVPMIVSKTENHSPEIEAVKHFENALFFETDSAKSFKTVLKQAFKDKEDWIGMREEICLFCKETYSVEAMGETFLKTLQ